MAFIGVMFITPDSLFIRLSNIETWGMLFYRGAIPFLVVPTKLGREGPFDQLTGFTTVVGDFFTSKEMPLFLKSLKVGLSVLVNVGLLGGVVC